jgi:hypothetical protein
VTGGASANPSWASVSGRVLLNTLTASSSASLSDTTSITSGYSEYDIVFENIIPATTSTSCEIQVHASGAFKTSSYAGVIFYAAQNGTGYTSSSTFIPCSYPGQSQNTVPGISGKTTIYTPSNTSGPKNTLGKFSLNQPGGGVNQFVDAAGYWSGGNDAVDGFQVLFSAGNITSGTIKVYGVN